MRRVPLLHLFVLPVVAFGLAGAGGAMAKPTPEQTVEALKRAVARGDRAGEWATLSPGFKLRLNEKVGRTVDVGDYEAFRREQARDPQIREMEQLLMTCRVLSVKYDGQGQAEVTIKFNKSAILGQSVKVQMIHHAHWELWVRGESQPYWGFVGSKSNEVVPHRDGSYTVRMRDKRGRVTWQQTFRADQVARYFQSSRWYFHDFGKAEEQFLGAWQG